MNKVVSTLVTVATAVWACEYLYGFYKRRKNDHDNNKKN